MYTNFHTNQYLLVEVGNAGTYEISVSGADILKSFDALITVLIAKGVEVPNKIEEGENSICHHLAQLR
jgi:hypothetical protein